MRSSLLLPLCLLWLGGCGLAAEDAPDPGACVAKDARYDVEFSVDPSPAGVGDHRLTVLVKDSLTRLFVEAPDIVATAWRQPGAPAAGAAMTRLFKGKYALAKLSFDAAGLWAVQVQWSSGGETVTACAPFTVGDFAVRDGGKVATSVASDSTAPVLSVAPVSLAGGPSKAPLGFGDLRCDQKPGQPPCITPFALGTGISYEVAGYLTFVTGPEAQVHAVTPGVVESVLYQSHSDVSHLDIFRVLTRAHKNAAFAVEYRNVSDVQVKVGDKVAPGQVIATVGAGLDADYGKVSLTVLRHQEHTQRVCPERFFAAPLSQQFDQAL